MIPKKETQPRRRSNSAASSANPADEDSFAEAVGVASFGAGLTGLLGTDANKSGKAFFAGSHVSSPVRHTSVLP